MRSKYKLKKLEKQKLQSKQQEKKADKKTPNLNNSFSKEFTNISEDLYDDDNNKLAQSYSYSQMNKYREEVLKGPLNTALESYLFSIIKTKNNKKGKTKFITQKDMSKFNKNLLTKQIDNKQGKEKEEYLVIRNNLPDHNKFTDTLKNYLDENNIQHLHKTILNVEYGLNTVIFNTNISPIFNLEYLFDKNFFNNPFFQMNDTMNIELSNKYNKLKQIIYKYREIKGDGNCYYRAVMFRYIEQIILNQNIILLKRVILDMNECFKSQEIKNRLQIKMDTMFKPELHLKIMILILYLLEKRKIQEAHQIFVKCILSCAIFDYGLILYFRYIIYLYIKNNENKLYSKNFPVKIGNLLPSKYENSKGEFEYNKFYTEYLLKMFMEAEKIIIYLTPFILEINLDIIIFEDNEEQMINRFSYAENNDISKPQTDVITILNRNNHYEIIYTYEQYNKYLNIFSIYELPEINNNTEENNILEQSTNSGFFLLQSNRNINLNNIIDEGVDNKTSNNINQRQKESENNNITSNKSIQNDTRKNNLVNKDNNETVIYESMIEENENMKNELMEIENEIETPIGHPENDENKEVLNEIDEMFDVNNNNKSCLKCKKPFDKYINNKLHFCNDCLKNEIFTQFKNEYSNYLRNKLYTKNKFKIKEIKIDNISINLKEILKIFNINNENNFVNLLKNNVCLKCFRAIEKKDSKMVDFPCGCCICNKDEFEIYFTVDNVISDKYTCICGYKYEPKDLYDLTVQCNKIGCDSIILFVINIFFKFILNRGCSGCGKNNKCEEITYDVDKKSSFCFENYLKLKNCNNINLVHLMCKDCKRKYRNQKYECYFCKRIHIYYPD